MKKKFLILLVILIALSSGAFMFYRNLFSAPQPGKEEVSLFIISRNDTEPEILARLEKEGFVRSASVMAVVLDSQGKKGKISPGGFYLPKNLDIWKLIAKLMQGPEMKWITFNEGMRKEQMGERLARELNWSQSELDDWNNLYTRMKFDYLEGVYFPDTYLIPVGEKNFEVVGRMLSRFNDQFAPYYDRFAKADILWTTGLKIASLIQREAGGKADMPIISAVIWNRLEKGMRLEIDATLQYVKGKVGDTWWSHVVPADKQLESPYNTYMNKGLPPAPIANPGLDAIEAVLNPADTDCLFYLHGPDKQIHCAVTYEEHLENIEKYLR